MTLHQPCTTRAGSPSRAMGIRRLHVVPMLHEHGRRAAVAFARRRWATDARVTESGDRPPSKSAPPLPCPGSDCSPFWVLCAPAAVAPHLSSCPPQAAALVFSCSGRASPHSPPAGRSPVGRVASLIPERAVGAGMRPPRSWRLRTKPALRGYQPRWR